MKQGGGKGWWGGPESFFLKRQEIKKYRKVENSRKQRFHNLVIKKKNPPIPEYVSNKGDPLKTHSQRIVESKRMNSDMPDQF